MKNMPAAVPCIVGLLSALAVGQNPNWVKTETFLDSAATVSSATTSYADGLGRSLQSRTETSAAGVDAVAGRIYDDAGRVVKSTVPFNPVGTGYVADPLSEANTTRSSDVEANGNYCFSEVRYKPDPLGRTDSVGAPGFAYSIPGGHFSRTWYCATARSAAGIIDDSGFVIAAHLTPEALDALESTPAHASPTHFLTVSKGPNDHEYYQEITDLFGRTVATRGTEGISARYVHDPAGNVLKEIPPHPTAAGRTDESMPTEYRYNTAGQLIYKKTPDGGYVEYKYDKAGRLFHTQNARQRWPQLDPANFTVYLYDRKGRIEAVGINNGNTAVDFAETSPLATPVVGPDGLDDINPRVRNVYDNAQNLTGVLPLTQTEVADLGLTNLRGRLVAAIAYDEANVSDPSAPDFWSHVAVDLFSYTDEGRIKAAFKRIPRSAAFTRHVYGYGLQGNVTADTFYDDCTATTPLWTRSYEYDRFGRVSAIRNSAGTLVATYSYDGYNRMSQKVFGNDAGSPLDAIQYFYTIRDWVSSINSVELSVFTENIDYSEPDDPSKKQYNGNIAEIFYAQPAGASMHFEDHTYTYDDASRLTGVAVEDMTDLAEAFTYQQNGRIATKSKSTATPGVYQYYQNTNRLNRIDNYPGKNGVDNYFYDPNGNMILDRSKKMVIEYDWRDMPVAFRFYDNVSSAATDWWTPDDWENSITDGGGVLVSEVRMVYDAAGNRVLKCSVEDPSPSAAGSFVLQREGVTILTIMSDGTLDKTVVQNSTTPPATGDFVVEMAGVRKLWTVGTAVHVAGRVTAGVTSGALVLESGNIRAAINASGDLAIQESGLRHVEKYIDNYTMEQEYATDGSLDKSTQWTSFADGRMEISYMTNGERTEQAKYYYKDHLGSTRVVLASSGQVIESARYSAYGEVAPLMTVLATEIETNEKFTGKEFDQEGAVAGVTEGIGLCHFRFRAYDAVAALWTSRDPDMIHGETDLGAGSRAQFWTAYGYATNGPVSHLNPVASIDPDGRWGFFTHAAVGGQDEFMIDIMHYYDIPAGEFAHRYAYSRKYQIRAGEYGSQVTVTFTTFEEYLAALNRAHVPEYVVEHLITDYYNEGEGWAQIDATITEQFISRLAGTVGRWFGEGDWGTIVSQAYEDTDFDLFLNPTGYERRVTELRKKQARLLYSSGYISKQEYQDRVDSARSRRTAYGVARVLAPVTTYCVFVLINVLRPFVGD